uniref:Uncharacterized protein n=1 Tax=Anguilla anguilla TaxID=7936 RepID=A0A0E9VCY0_ANGAN
MRALYSTIDSTFILPFWGKHTNLQNSNFGCSWHHAPLRWWYVLLSPYYIRRVYRFLTYLDDWLILAAFLEVILGEMKFTRA